MMIQLEMGPNFARVVDELSSMGTAVIEACSEGLAKGVKIAASNVSKNYLSGQALKSRTGMLARSVDGWLANPLDGVVGVKPNSAVEKYKWLLTDESKTITPKKGKFLTIPIGEALTGAGVLKGKYSGGLRSITEGFFVKSKTGKLLFGIRQGKRGKFRPLFVLVKSVFVQGSGALYDGVTDSLDDIAGEIESQIDRKIKD